MCETNLTSFLSNVPFFFHTLKPMDFILYPYNPNICQTYLIHGSLFIDFCLEQGKLFNLDGQIFFQLMNTFFSIGYYHFLCSILLFSSTQLFLKMNQEAFPSILIIFFVIVFLFKLFYFI